VAISNATVATDAVGVDAVICVAASGYNRIFATDVAER
jgi:hypothetical protein